MKLLKMAEEKAAAADAARTERKREAAEKKKAAAAKAAAPSSASLANGTPVASGDALDPFAFTPGDEGGSCSQKPHRLKLKRRSPMGDPVTVPSQPSPALGSVASKDPSALPASKAARPCGRGPTGRDARDENRDRVSSQ